MAGHKLLKRKGIVDEVHDDFPLASPATKIRRLVSTSSLNYSLSTTNQPTLFLYYLPINYDAELPPIVEEEEPLPLPLPLPNEERALVLFKPLAHSPPSFSLTLDSDLMSEIRNNQIMWSKQCANGSESREKDNDELALVPWVPPPSYQLSNVDDSDYTNTELMEADEMGEGEGEGVCSTMMDIEQENETETSISTSTIQYPGITEGFQQHCLLPQLPHNTSTPITWTR
ncbi:hypothetical protein CR513_41437, partial [Mucuna pruriens]